MANPIKTKPLSIRDEVHGDITFDELLKAVIDHEYFQRLRRIKQLGLAEFVFPCATHTRFQHSLGAAYLAGEYFASLIESGLGMPFQSNLSSGKTKVLAEETLSTLEKVVSDPTSTQYWRQVAGLAGLLHDVGHGPWSHTFEYLDLKLDFERNITEMPGAVGEYFRQLKKNNQPIKHEEISVIYIFQIFQDLVKAGTIDSIDHYFLPVAALINRHMTGSVVKNEIEAEIGRYLKTRGLQGGLEMHRLLRPLISGPFDVDRIDYIQRDGRNCGVSIGGIEWRRIVGKLLPCLAEHEGEAGEPEEVVLLSHVKNQHVLDDFIFSLFQMYAQVYLHPKIVGLEEILKRILEKKPRVPLVIDFEAHRKLSDENFRELLIREFGGESIEKLLLRKAGAAFEVASLPSDFGMEKEIRDSRFTLIDTLDRPMMKDSVGVFLFSLFTEGKGETKNLSLQAWSKASPLAQQFQSMKYRPKIWYRLDSPDFL